jgi:hypothetical protein
MGEYVRHARNREFKESTVPGRVWGDMGYRLVNVHTAQRDLEWWLRWTFHRVALRGR